jgi:hypothetical protein
MSSLEKEQCDMMPGSQNSEPVARKCIRKHVPAVMDMYATIEKLLEGLISTWSVPKLYNTGQQNWKSEFESHDSITAETEKYRHGFCRAQNQE